MTPVFPVPFTCWMSILSDKNVTLIGIGNRYAGDDGIAPTLLESICSGLSEHIELQLWEDKDALSISADLLDIHTPVIIVDCADMGLEAGAYRWFKASECQLSQHMESVSTHGFGFSDALQLAQTLGFEQPLYFFAIQPEQMEPGESLSPALQKNLKRYEDALLHQLNQFGVEGNHYRSSIKEKHMEPQKIGMI